VNAFSPDISFQVDLGRNYRVTKVALQSGALEQLMNVDVRLELEQGSLTLARLGASDQSGAGNNRITGNTRCGIYYGPTLVANQWVEVSRGDISVCSRRPGGLRL
jgi:hypothetical protein